MSLDHGIKYVVLLFSLNSNIVRLCRKGVRTANHFSLPTGIDKINLRIPTLNSNRQNRVMKKRTGKRMRFFQVSRSILLARQSGHGEKLSTFNIRQCWAHPISFNLDYDVNREEIKECQSRFPIRIET
jgi:hypothetical protein